MAVFDAPVCLTRSAPHEGFSGQLVFYDVVESSTISKSSVLSCIAEAGGEVVLPDSIRLPEFRTWIAATNANQAAINVMPITSICTVLKVADALDDAGLDDWINTAADRLTRYARCPEEPDDLPPHDIADSLTLLTYALQNRLLTRVTRHASEMHSLLDRLPSHLHHALVAASISPAKELDVPLHDRTLPIFKALSAIPARPPPILSLSVHSPEEDSTLHEVWQEAAPRLAQALQHHSGITSLRLVTQHNDAASAMLLVPALAKLTSLQCLHLHAGINTATSSSLQQTLQALPQIQDLSLSLVLATDSLTSQHDGSTDEASQCCLATLLTPATQLTSLWLCVYADNSKQWFTASKPLALPRLVQLNVMFEEPWNSDAPTAPPQSHIIAATSLLSHLAAPLTSLVLQRGAQTPPLEAEDAPHAQRLFSSLAGFTQLRRLRVAAPHDQDADSAAVMHAVTAAAPPALAALRHLEHLSFTADVPVVLASVPLLSGTTSLSHLRLVCWHSPQAALTPDAAEQLLNALSRLSLCRLDLEAAGCAGALPGLAHLRLRELTRLSALRVRGWECLSTEGDIAALSSMTHLRKLHLNCVYVAEELHHRLVRALAALSGLTSFAQQGNNMQDTFMDDLAHLAPAGMWPEVRELCLDLWPPSAEPVAVFGFARTLPALKHLVLDVPEVPSENPGSHEALETAELVEEVKAEARFAVTYVSEFPF